MSVPEGDKEPGKETEVAKDKQPTKIVDVDELDVDQKEVVKELKRLEYKKGRRSSCVMNSLMSQI